MKKLLAFMIVLLVPGLSIAGEGIVLKTEASILVREDSSLPDISFAMAHICAASAIDCLPSNLVQNPFAAYIKFFVPATQEYARYLFVTDIEGAVVGFSASTSSLLGGSINNIFASFSLPSGKSYRFFALVIGANGKMAASDSYIFKVN